MTFVPGAPRKFDPPLHVFMTLRVKQILVDVSEVPLKTEMNASTLWFGFIVQNKFNGRKIVLFAVASAVCHYHGGAFSKTKVDRRATYRQALSF